jgi:hypothetical protein
MLKSMAMLLAVSFALASEPSAQDRPVALATPLALATTVTDPYATRPRARILSSLKLRNFEVRREDANDWIVYLETARNTWFRGEMICRGGGDPRDAHLLEPVSYTGGIDANTSLVFRDLSSQTSVCSLVNLISLTPEEILDLKLVRPPKAKKG